MDQERDDIDSQPATGPGEAGAPGRSDDEVTAPDPIAFRRSRTSLLTWGTVALVLVIVVVLVAVKVSGTSPTSTPSGPAATQPAPGAVVQAATAIPTSVFDAVGVSSPVAAVAPPTLLQGQPALDYSGKPGFLFVGNEFCPYCAAQRWAVVAALSRFGKLSGLDSMQSGSNEAFPGTPTFTFADTHYSSRYLAATLVEHYGVQKNSAGTAYAVLQPLTAPERTLLARYADPTSSGTGPLLPFVDVANRAIVAGGSFSPAILQQLTVTKIASGLSDPKDPTTEAIVAAANYLSAAICAADGERPAAVCASKGVTAADAAVGLKS